MFPTGPPLARWHASLLCDLLSIQTRCEKGKKRAEIHTAFPRVMDSRQGLFGGEGEGEDRGERKEKESTRFA